MTDTMVDIHAHRGSFFEVLQETARTQTAVMTIAPGRDGGPEETHAGDQVVFVVEGEAIVTVEGIAHQARAGACVLIPAGTSHHVRNSGPRPLFFLSVYAPPAY
ncbi:MAG TPA: cupin domain-containing protein [Methylomirabilota bacterium]|jgi:mannose-6-phosphate isomerase-like protein (cupin superfamily)|nr:cupin domain-containing protein [Methylomirabilota bacterium]